MRGAMKRFQVLALCCVALVIGGQTSAQGPSTSPAPRDAALERIEELERTATEQQKEIDQLGVPESRVEPDPEMGSERTRYNPSRGWLANYGGFSLDLDIHGFINLEFFDPGEDGEREGDSTFDLHHANVFVDVSLLPNLRSHLELEFEHALEAVEIDQAYVEWGIHPWLQLTAGRFYAPFGIERFAWYPMANQLVSRPIAFREVIPGSFYQTGLMFSGAFECNQDLLLTYQASVSNGLGEDAPTDRRASRQTRDNNSNKAVTGRIAAVAWSVVEVGLSGHIQDYQSVGSDQRIYFVGGDFSGRWKGAELRAEYVHAKAQQNSMAPLEQQSWYLQLAYTLPLDQPWMDSVTAVGRVDGANLDRDVRGNNDRMRYSIGTVLRIYDHFQVKAEYQFATERGDAIANDAFLAALVLDF